MNNSGQGSVILQDSAETRISRIKNLSMKMKGKNNPFYGRKHSIETKQKISKSRIGNDWSIHRKVNQYNLDGTFLNQYESLAEANRQTKVSIAGICQCCRGIYKKSGGFIWRYADEN